MTTNDDQTRIDSEQRQPGNNPVPGGAPRANMPPPLPNSPRPPSPGAGPGPSPRPKPVEKGGGMPAGAIGAAGVVGGAAAAVAFMSFKTPDEPMLEPEPEEPEEPGETGGGITVSVSDPSPVLFDLDSIPIAYGVSDDMTFSEAFAAARQEVGPGGVFQWNGNVYGTYYANEWENLSSEQQNAFSNHPHDFSQGNSGGTGGQLAGQDPVVPGPTEPMPGEVNATDVVIAGHDVRLIDVDGDGSKDIAVVTFEGGDKQIIVLDPNVGISQIEAVIGDSPMPVDEHGELEIWYGPDGQVADSPCDDLDDSVCFDLSSSDDNLADFDNNADVSLFA